MIIFVFIEHRKNSETCLSEIHVSNTIYVYLYQDESLEYVTIFFVTSGFGG